MNLFWLLGFLNKNEFVFCLNAANYIGASSSVNFEINYLEPRTKRS